MKTKFYNALRKEYDPDTHYAIENWDVSADYSADEYAKVYFRIDCQTFDCTSASFASADMREAFYDEMKGVLRSFGIVESSGYCRGNEMPEIEYLYIHPQNISGIVAKSKIVAIAEAINACKYAFCRSVDVYEDIAPISNEQFLEMLPARKDEITADILSAFTTKRKNLFYGEYAAGQLLDRISAKYSIRRRQCESGTDYTAKDFCNIVLTELVKAGKVITAHVKDGTGYRTAKKNEIAVA